MSSHESGQQGGQSEPAETAHIENREGISDGDYSKEFERRMLVVESVDPKTYTAEMRDEDLKYLDEWFRYELGRHKMLLKQHTEELRKKTRESSGNAAARQEVMQWTQKTLDEINEAFNSKKEEIWGLKERVLQTFLYKDTPKEEGKKEEVNQEDKEEEKPNNKKEGEADTTQIEQSVLDSFSITGGEYKIILESITTLNNADFRRLLTNVMEVETASAKEVRDAYLKLTRELHPDTATTSLEKEVKSAKIQVVNTMYQEYKRRFGKEGSFVTWE